MCTIGNAYNQLIPILTGRADVPARGHAGVLQPGAGGRAGRLHQPHSQQPGGAAGGGGGGVGQPEAPGPDPEQVPPTQGQSFRSHCIWEREREKGGGWSA